MSGGMHSRGVSLAEVMVVVAMLAILAVLAAPQFTDAVREARLTSQINQLVFALNLARSEAVKRAGAVTVCPSANGTACANDGRWEAGWIVFADTDADQSVDADEAVLQRMDPLREGFTLRASSAFGGAVTFDAKGTTPVAGNFILCADADIREARAVGVQRVGRIRRGGDADKDGQPDALDGTEITSCTDP